MTAAGRSDLGSLLDYSTMRTTWGRPQSRLKPIVLALVTSLLFCLFMLRSHLSTVAIPPLQYPWKYPLDVADALADDERFLVPIAVLEQETKGQQHVRDLAQ